MTGHSFRYGFLSYSSLIRTYYGNLETGASTLVSTLFKLKSKNIFVSARAIAFLFMITSIHHYNALTYTSQLEYELKVRWARWSSSDGMWEGCPCKGNGHEWCRSQEFATMRGVQSTTLSVFSFLSSMRELFLFFFADNTMPLMVIERDFLVTISWGPSASLFLVVTISRITTDFFPIPYFTGIFTQWSVSILLFLAFKWFLEVI